MISWRRAYHGCQLSFTPVFARTRSLVEAFLRADRSCCTHRPRTPQRRLSKGRGCRGLQPLCCLAPPIVGRCVPLRGDGAAVEPRHVQAYCVSASCRGLLIAGMGFIVLPSAQDDPDCWFACGSQMRAFASTTRNPTVKLLALRLAKNFDWCAECLSCVGLIATIIVQVLNEIGWTNNDDALTCCHVQVLHGADACGNPRARLTRASRVPASAHSEFVNFSRPVAVAARNAREPYGFRKRFRGTVRRTRCRT
jgi:hypothetical protein